MASRLCRLRRESYAHGGQAEEEEAEEMRIADILREEEEELCCSNSKGSSRRRRWGRRRQRNTPFSSSSPRPPRCLLSRWLPSKQLLKCKPCGMQYKDEELVEKEEGEEGGDVTCPTLGSAAAPAVEGSTSAGVEEESVSNSEAAASSSGCDVALASSEEANTNGSGRKPEQACLSIGMGVGLLFLLSRSITEFNKMTELRREMEVLLKEAKEEIQGKDPSTISGESKNNLTFCGSDSWADTEQSNDLALQDCDPCLELVETSCDTELDSHSKCNDACEVERSPRIDEIEAELVSELELLQINLDNQDSSEQFRAELSGERTDPSESFSVSLGERSEPKEQAAEEEQEEDDVGDRYGVCPHELARRLHELLETRQQERIAELESALKLAHIKLQEKEMEVRLWRDAAQLVSQNEEETHFR